ncbi:beta-ketoacyl synthase chain length factor [Mucilaginibacter koreensis]
MFYIYKATCISPQQTFGAVDLDNLRESADNKLQALEPRYEGIPANVLRRMSKTVKLGTAAATPLIDAEHPPQGIIMGSGNGGMEESGRFLNQIVEYDEDMLTPGNFVQSTPNTVTSQLCLLLKRREYNITHVQRGLSFENALMDTDMLLKEYPDKVYLLGGVDEIASYNHEIDKLSGWFKQEAVNNRNLYYSSTPGSIAGEGVAMFLTGTNAAGAMAQVQAYTMSTTTDAQVFRQQLTKFLQQHLPQGGQIDLLLSGDGGDSRQTRFYEISEALVGADTTIARFKHMCGEYPTASAFAMWLSCMLVSGGVSLPAHAVKKQGSAGGYHTILIHNTHKGAQHSLMLVRTVKT